VAAEEEEQKKGQGKGFAGLSSLVSEVDTTLPPPAKQDAGGLGASSRAERATASQNAQTGPQPAQPQPYRAPSQPSAGSSTGKWVLGIVAVIGVIWLLGQANKSPTPPAPAYPSAAQNTAPTYSAPPASPQAPSRPEETRPPVGQNLVFSTAQIRYCLAEDIRMDAAKSAVNSYSDSDVDRFNAMVADYNSRCGSFRYRSGALESARRDIEPYRSQLQAEGRSKFARPSTGSLSTPAQSRPVPDATVQAIQRKLNELGYEAGTADGLMGSGTRLAIIAFQQDRGLAASGVADQALLLQLQRAPARSSGGWGANDPVVQEGPPRTATTTTAPLSVPRSPSVPAAGPPANSWVSGSSWYCNDGYKKVGNSCEKLIVPRNAWVSGSNWYCNDGFRKVGDECVALNVPDNAWVSGSNWYCNDGYRKAGDRCERLNVPRNAWVSGSNWYCNDGFRKVGDQCVALDVPDNAWVSGSNWYCNDGYRKVGDRCVSVYER
jgi:hypothetical protein